MINDLVISQIRQRLEILYQMVDQLEEGGGGGGGGTTNYNELSNKPAIEGHQLVGNKTASELGLATTSQLNGKVDKVEGSSLMTSAQATKLEGIEAGAEVNVQADWNQANSSADDYIKNKPTLGAAAEKGVDTVPTDGSDNLITSGAVYDAVQGGGGGGISDLVPVNVGNNVATFPEEYRYLLQKHLPFTFTPSYPYAGWAGSEWKVVSENPSSYICMASKINNSTGAWLYIFMIIQKSNWSWGNITPSNAYQVINNIYFRQFQFDETQVQTIAANTNLDNSQLGRFYCTAANAATLTNCPTTDAFYLVAEFSTSANRIQTITTDTAIPVVYRRIKTGGTWGSWYKFEGTVVS